MSLKNYANAGLPVKRHSFRCRHIIIYVKQFTGRMKLCMKIKRERRQLGKLTDSELQDIGISRADVDKECRRHFLDVPTSRTKPTEKIS